MADKKNAAIAIFDHHNQAEAAIKELQRAGIDMKKLSIVGRDYHTEEHVTGYYNTGDRMKYWGKLGAFWGGLWGFLFGAAFFWVPGLGPLVVGGPLVSWMVGALEGAVAVGGLGVAAVPETVAPVVPGGARELGPVDLVGQVLPSDFSLLREVLAGDLEKARGRIPMARPEILDLQRIGSPVEQLVAAARDGELVAFVDDRQVGIVLRCAFGQ